MCDGDYEKKDAKCYETYEDEEHKKKSSCGTPLFILGFISSDGWSSQGNFSNRCCRKI